MKQDSIKVGEEYYVLIPTPVRVTEKRIPRKTTYGGKPRERRDLVRVVDREGKERVVRSEFIRPTYDSLVRNLLGVRPI